MRRKKILAILLLSTLLFGSQTIGTTQDHYPHVSSEKHRIEKRNLRAVHEALLETYFPFELEAVPQHHKELARQQGEELWHTIENNRQLKNILVFFTRLELFSIPLSSTVYKNFVSKTNSFDKQEVRLAVDQVRLFLKQHGREKGWSTHFAELTVEERRNFLNLLSSSPLEWYRRIALSLRILYVSKIYWGELGMDLAELVDPDKTEHEQKRNGVPPPQNFYEFPEFKTHLKYDPSSRKLTGHFDYLIVGSGVAGSMIAYQLQRAGKSVVMLEKGPMVHPWHFDARNKTRFLRDRGLLLNQLGDVIISTAEVAGGGSSVNFDLTFPVTDPWVMANFTYWRESGMIPESTWPEEKLIAASHEAMALLDVRTVSFDEVNANNNILLQGAKARGLNPHRASLTTLEEGEQKRQGYYTNKNSAVKQLLWPALLNEKGTSPLTLLVNAEVTRILFDGKARKAIGVKFKTGKRKNWEGTKWDLYGFSFPEEKELCLYADKVILTAGAVGTTIILKKSKINNPNIGKGIVCHPILPIVGLTHEVIDNHIGVPSAVFVPDYLTTDYRHPKVDFMVETSSYPVFRYAMSIPGIADELYERIKKYRFATGAGVVFMDQVDPDNRIEVMRNGKPRIFYALPHADQARLTEAIAETSSLLLAGGVEEILLNITQDVFDTGPGSSQIIRSQAQIDTLRKRLLLQPSTTLMYSGHIMSSNKMGTHPSNSVVNGNHEVWGFKNLYICDASIFPSSVSANPMMAVYVVANLFALQLLEEGKESKNLTDSLF